MRRCQTLTFAKSNEKLAFAYVFPNGRVFSRFALIAGWQHGAPKKAGKFRLHSVL
jgi:hypothetical protein